MDRNDMAQHTAAKQAPPMPPQRDTSTSSPRSSRSPSSQAMSAPSGRNKPHSTSASDPSSVLRQRNVNSAAGSKSTSLSQSQLDGPGDSNADTHSTMPTLEPSSSTPHPKWVALALFSGAFAAMNGVFAKLTTSDNTASFANSLARFVPFITLDLLTVLLRAAFFGLNIASNAVMWMLFTRALVSHPSTTKVSIVNTSANFTITAVMGALIFGEAVGGFGGIAGLALLVGGCVVLGAEEKKDKTDAIDGEEPIDTEAAETLIEDHNKAVEDLIDLDDEAKIPGATTSTSILEGTESDEEFDLRRL